MHLCPPLLLLAAVYELPSRCPSLQHHILQNKQQLHNNLLGVVKRTHLSPSSCGQKAISQWRLPLQT